MDATRVFVAAFLVALAIPNWSQAAPNEKPSVVAVDKSGDYGASACTDCSEEPSWFNRNPRVYGEVDAVFLTRNAGYPENAFLINADTQESLVSSSDLDFGFSPGVRALFGLRLGDGRSVEFGYLGLTDLRASTDFAQPNQNVNVTLPGDLGIASNVFQGDVRTRIDYLSRLQGAEVSFVFNPFFGGPGSGPAGPAGPAGAGPAGCGYADCGCDTSGYADCQPATTLDWLVGFRYISLRENLRISGARTANAGDETAYYDISSRNDLFGAQLGARIRHYRGRFAWETAAKAGIFGNSAGQEQVFVDYPNSYLLRPTTGGNGGNAAFVGEFDLTGIYQLNRTWGLRLGYSLLWISGVALAPDQADFTLTSTSGTALNAGGGAFFHGATAGLEARW